MTGEEEINHKGVAEVVLNYIFRGEECNSMSVYEMALRMSVVSATEDQMVKYKECVRTTSARHGRPWNQKSMLHPLHPKSLSIWITFWSEEHTPVILGKQCLT